MMMFSSRFIARNGLAYCQEFKMRRRCKATRKDGNRCKGYAVWEAEHCVFHGGKPTAGKRDKNCRLVCHCGTNGEGGGYRFPHKLGGGKYCVCFRNGVKPTHTMGPGQHSFPRVWGIEKALARFLESRWRLKQKRDSRALGVIRM